MPKNKFLFLVGLIIFLVLTNPVKFSFGQNLVKPATPRTGSSSAAIKPLLLPSGQVVTANQNSSSSRQPDQNQNRVGGKKIFINLIIEFIVGLVVIGLIFGSIYFYNSKQR
ncbi:MAG: hypothetical protein M1505_02630 [Patescibacteria group bacterium]|nr:hypothetical protein [Patescibacteria group bacterium]